MKTFLRNFLNLLLVLVCAWMISGGQNVAKAQYSSRSEFHSSRISSYQPHLASDNLLKLASSDSDSGDRQYYINLSPFEYEQEEESRQDDSRKYYPASDLAAALNVAIALSFQQHILAGALKIISGAAFKYSTRIFILLEVFRI
ncbi:MAG: hypothetical protein KDC13_07025 [Bacteroidetes bacterium]|nr:hypothetical protein [Bacteroidota bacterium]